MTNETMFLVLCGESGRILMSAPLDVIQSVFNLHQSAVDRITREATSGRCELNFNGRRYLGVGKVVITLD